MSPTGPRLEERSMHTGGPPSDSRSVISLYALINVVLRHRKLIVLLPIITAIVIVVVTYFLPPTYTVTATFIPSSSESSVSGLAGIAAQFGVQIPGTSTDPTTTPDFYADLLQSPIVLNKVVTTPFTFVSDGDTVIKKTLIDIYEEDQDTPGKNIRSAVDDFTDNLTVSTDATTSLVTVTVKSKYGPLSTMILQRMLDLVNEFNLQSRQQQAQDERKFIESRLDSARIELTNSENELEQFSNRNRSYKNDPMLSLEFDRLSREVSMRQQVMTGLAQSYEQARISAVRDTPAIVVVQAPELPLAADKKKLLIKAALGIIGGGILALFIAFTKDMGSRASHTDSADYEGFVALRERTLDDLSRLVPPWRKRRQRRRDEASAA